MNCNNFQTEIEEIDLAADLNPRLQAHLSDCKNCESFFVEQKNLRQLVGNLERVSAPNDFEIQLRKRLIQGKQNSFRLMRWQRYASALPVLAFAMFLGTWLLTQPEHQAEVNTASVPKAELSQAPDSVEMKSPPIPAPKPQDSNVGRNRTNTIPGKTVPKERVTSVVRDEISTPKNAKKSTVGLIQINHQSPKEENNSRDLAVKNVPPSIGPKGFPPKSKNLTNETPNVSVNILNMNDTFKQLGIEAEINVEKVWRVKNVYADSVGESSGVKTNDIIEAIDGQPISAETKTKSFSGKTLNVVRDGKKIEIKIQSKP